MIISNLFQLPCLVENHSWCTMFYLLLPGLSGIDTCKMIKEMVPYPNKKGKNMECFLQYLPNSPKRGEIQRDLAGAGHNTKDKVIIYAVYETNRVIATPQMNGPNSEIGSV
mmetsp:Transcript_20337/g.40316  ORF Transcript_20337/g.40316 Transcript_20337/m.40316 type:complete len:111 (-) Transcript_20337:310-642(-)